MTHKLTQKCGSYLIIRVDIVIFLGSGHKVLKVVPWYVNLKTHFQHVCVDNIYLAGLK